MASFPLVSATGMLGSGFRAESQGLHFKLAVIHSELSRDVVHRHLRDGRARALPPSAPLSDTDIDAATHIVGMMGVEPIQEALKSGAQIVVAGRSSDTSIFSALPLLEGYAPAVVWHMAKILECGAAAVAVRTAPDCMMAELHEDSFDVFPLREDYHCTPQSVASHTLYENADPFELKEPSGTVRWCFMPRGHTITTSGHRFCLWITVSAAMARTTGTIGWIWSTKPAFWRSRSSSPRLRSRNIFGTISVTCTTRMALQTGAKNGRSVSTNARSTSCERRASPPDNTTDCLATLQAGNMCIEWSHLDSVIASPSLSVPTRALMRCRI